MSYREAAEEGRLELQRCAECGRVRHYPQPLCPACHSFAVEPLDAAGTGMVHSWTVCAHPFSPELADEVPYTLVTVDLPEGVRVLGRLSGDAQPWVGMPVTIGFEPGGRGPMCAPAPDQG